MPWVRLDEEFPDHPKVVTAGPLAGWLHVCALAYCNRHLTDGFVPHAQVGRLVNFAGIIDLDVDPGPMDARDLPDASPYVLADRLVALGMWEKRQGGYVIHDFLDYQPSRAEIEAQRKVKSEAGKAGGRRSGESRRSKAEADLKQTAKQNGSRTEPEPEPDHEAKGQAKTKPVPVPVPSVDRSSSSLDRVGERPGEEEELQGKINTTARLVAERRLSIRTGPPLTNPSEWLRTVRTAVIADHGAELQAMAEQGMNPKAMADRIQPPPASPYPDAGQATEPAWDESIDEHGHLVAVPRRAG